MCYRISNFPSLTHTHTHTHTCAHHLYFPNRYKESAQLFPLEVDSRGDSPEFECLAGLSFDDNPGITRAADTIHISLQGLLIEFIRAFSNLCDVSLPGRSRAGSRNDSRGGRGSGDPSHEEPSSPSPLDVATVVRDMILGLPELILLDLLLMPGTISRLLQPVQQCVDRGIDDRPGTALSSEHIMATEYVLFVVDLCARISR
jgi:hypothetical protein